ncbi:hypothetical protein BGZ76_004688 [Entomortierella beljakovae]|nr:hypothetical protein BGZ76_004688 [Entomortierella beljakovae]
MLKKPCHSLLFFPSGLPPQKALKLINLYLENTSNSTDLDFTLILCEVAETSLSHMRKIVKKSHSSHPTGDTHLHSNISIAYFNHAELLENLGHPEKAQASHKKTEYLSAGYKDQFQPIARNNIAGSGLFQETVLAPFSMEQVQEYIKAYVIISRPL